MTPEYVMELADIADPDQLWRRAGMDQLELPPDKRRQLDTGVALRRYASHLRDLRDLILQARSLLITPISGSITAVRSVDTPPDHAKTRQEWTNHRYSPTPPRLTYGDVVAIAQALATMDGYDIQDKNCGLHDLRWSTGPSPEPLGDAWNMDYLPKAETIARAIGYRADEAEST